MRAMTITAPAMIITTIPAKVSQMRLSLVLDFPAATGVWLPAEVPCEPVLLEAGVLDGLAQAGW